MLLLAAVLNGCTNYVYQGSIKAEDSAGQQREMLLFWSKTDPLIGDEKADLAHLFTECGSLVVFQNQPGGIIFRGEPQRDRLPGAAVPKQGETMECGKILGAQRLIELGKGRLSLTIQCEPVSNDFSVQPRRYPRARDAAYEFVISESKSWSFTGDTPEVPKPPKCNE